MLRITVQDSLQSVALKLEGQLTGPGVEETERVWKNCGRPVAVVDLCGVTWVDGQGTKLLARMYKGGANLVAYTPVMTHIIEVLTRNETGRVVDDCTIDDDVVVTARGLGINDVDADKVVGGFPAMDHKS
jgi:hypothetical protein